MSGLQFQVDESPSVVQRAVRALLPILFGLVFMYIGSTKFQSGSIWVALFERIGLGQWFRYFTGATQIAGGALTVMPGTRIAGAAILACTMLGATIVDLFVLHMGPAAVIPFALFGAAVAVIWSVWLTRD